MITSKRAVRQLITAERQRNRPSSRASSQSRLTPISYKRKRNHRPPTEDELKIKRQKLNDFLGKHDICNDLGFNSENLLSITPTSSTVTLSYSSRDLNQSDNESVSSMSSSSMYCLLEELESMHELLHRKDSNDELPRHKNVYKEDYVVENICEINEVKTLPKFLVKWKNYPKETNTWEPLAHVEECKPFQYFIRKQFSKFIHEIEDLWHELANCPLQHSTTTDSEIIAEVSKFNFNQFQSDFILLARMSFDRSRQTKTFSTIRERLTKTVSLIPSILRRLYQLNDLAKWQNEINSVDKSRNLRVENNIDFERRPTKFTYTNDVIPGVGVTIPNDPPIGCECTDNGMCNKKSLCCSKTFGSQFAYNKKHSICVPLGTPIFECNKRCKCGPNCMNRVVQNGRTHSLCIFKTSNGCGWGVRTNRTIAVGQFICEYVGEIITYEETERRGKIYDAVGRTYLFDLDFNNLDNPYTVDAAECGNVSHFINHSCDPNAGVWAVWTDCLDLDLPKICLFSLRRIDAGEEITFDYTNQNSKHEREMQTIPQTTLKTDEDNSNSFTEYDFDAVEVESLDESDNVKPLKIAPTECKCGSKNCRKFLF